MKKLFLLLAAGSFALHAGAQERRASSVVFNAGHSVAKKNAFRSGKALVNGNHFTAARTTANGGSRWYDYADSVLALNGNSVTQILEEGVVPLWNDTSAVIGYNDGTYAQNDFTSVGLSFDPYISAFNDPTVFPGQIKVGTSDAYVIDSVEVVGLYQRPAIAGTYNDQLRISLVYGNGTSASDLPSYYFTAMGNYNVDTLSFVDMLHDSTNNQAGGTTVVSHTFNLTAADTSTVNFFDRKYAVNFSVPAANYAAISIGFKTGDPSYPTFPAGDTLRYDDANSTLKHSLFYPAIAFAADGSGNATFPPYSLSDQNVGFYKEEGANDGQYAGNYVPNWAWTDAATGGASVLQYPLVLFHVTCASCTLTDHTAAVANINAVSGVKAFPNPATSELNIAFTLAQAANTTVTLVNVLGQTVAAQTVNNTTSARVTFNTATLAAGMYVYSINANGAITTGHVVVAH